MQAVCAHCGAEQIGGKRGADDLDSSDAKRVAEVISADVVLNAAADTTLSTQVLLAAELRMWPALRDAQAWARLVLDDAHARQALLNRAAPTVDALARETLNATASTNERLARWLIDDERHTPDSLDAAFSYLMHEDWPAGTPRGDALARLYEEIKTRMDALASAVPAAWEAAYSAVEHRDAPALEAALRAVDLREAGGLYPLAMLAVRARDAGDAEAPRHAVLEILTTNQLVAQPPDAVMEVALEQHDASIAELLWRYYDSSIDARRSLDARQLGWLDTARQGHMAGSNLYATLLVAAGTRIPSS